MGAHSGDNMATVVATTLQQFGVGYRRVGYFVLDNATNNDAAFATLSSRLDFNPTYRRLRCGPHTLNLIGQVLLWGRDADAFDNEVGAAAELGREHELMEEWRGNGPLGVLLAVIAYIKTP